MDIFISWSKERSRMVAEALRDWLPDVIQSVRPWTSSADVGAGARWNDEVARALAKAKIGIICVTPENQKEPWLLFEAGALAKAFESAAFVCPYLIDMRPPDLAAGPLTQFQAKVADKQGTLALVSTINSVMGEGALPGQRLERLFERGWPDLEARLAVLPRPEATESAPPNQADMLAEVLETVRSLARRTPELSVPIHEPGPAYATEEVRALVRQALLRRVLQHFEKFGGDKIAVEVEGRLMRLSDVQLSRLHQALRSQPDRPGLFKLADAFDLLAIHSSPEPKLTPDLPTPTD